MKINRREVCTFLSGAFFAGAGVLLYLYATRTPAPLMGTDLAVAPGVNGVGSIVPGGLFVETFYFGFMRK
jgi:hypothetical protein